MRSRASERIAPDSRHRTTDVKSFPAVGAGGARPTPLADGGVGNTRRLAAYPPCQSHPRQDYLDKCRSGGIALWSCNPTDSLIFL